MSVPVIAFFNNKGGVGKTTLVYHVAWMYADMGYRVVAADFDPQANLTAAFLDEDRLEELWEDEESENTILGCILPQLERAGDINDPHLEEIGDNLGLIVGDLSLTRFEDLLSENWPKCLSGDVGAFRILSAFWRIVQRAAENYNADIILMDLGPNLGAINRAALISTDFVVVPLSPDLFSLQGLKNLGPTFRNWRLEWGKRKREVNPQMNFKIPAGNMNPIGYVILQHSIRLDRPSVYYSKWIDKIPTIYREYVLNEPRPSGERTDRHRLALLKHYRSLMPMAHEARKPIFHLKSADGAIGAHFTAAREAGKDFKELAKEILKRSGVKDARRIDKD